MKILSILLLVTLGLTLTCNAKLGETASQARARYGPVIRRDKVDGRAWTFYKFGRYQVGVEFLNDKSAEETVSPSEDRPFTPEEITTLMKTLSGVSEWQQDKTKTKLGNWWHTDDGFYALLNDESRKPAKLTVFAPGRITIWDVPPQRKSPASALNPGGPGATNTPAGGTVAADGAGAGRPTPAEKQAALEKAVFKFRLEHARMGDPSSMYKLGELYLAGQGCRADTNQAKFWLKRAADEGNKDAAAASKRWRHNFVI